MESQLCGLASTLQEFGTYLLMRRHFILVLQQSTTTSANHRFSHALIHVLFLTFQQGGDYLCNNTVQSDDKARPILSPKRRKATYPLPYSFAQTTGGSEDHRDREASKATAVLL